MIEIQKQTPVSDLVALKVGDRVKQGSVCGTVEKIDFEEANNYWEMILTLNTAEKIYIRKQKTMC